MSKLKFEVICHLNERASLNRPSWTSEQSTGMFNAHRHKHAVERGKFKLGIDYWTKRFEV